MPLPTTSTRARAIAALAASAALIGALAACGAQDGQGVDDGGSSHSGVAAMKDAPLTSIDEDPTRPETWVIADGSVGEVRLGADFAGALTEIDDGWHGIGACGAGWSDDAGFEVTFSARGDQIAQIAVAGEVEAPSQGPRTVQGLGLGSTRDEVRAVYPSAEEVPVPESDVVELRPAGADLTGADLAFEVAGTGRVIGITLASPDAPAAPGC